MARWFFVFGIFGLFLQASGNNKYDNYTLMRIYPQTEEKVEAVVKFVDPEGEVEMLKGSRGVNDSMDVLVPQRRMGFMSEFVSDSDIMYDKKENYGMNFEAVERTPRRRAMNSFNLYSFHPYQEMLEYVRGVASAHPDLVTLQYPGNSYQGRPLVLVKISTKPSANNPIIFIDAGIHAREWVAPSMALYLIHRLTSNPDAKKHELNGVDWYILPLVNPDGYEYSRSSPSNRLWRKTRSKGDLCYGVDGNRNFDFQWKVSGASSNHCDKEAYAGPHPFSEKETQANRLWRKTRSKHFICYGVDGNRNYGYKWAVSGVSRNPCDGETYAGPKPFSESETRVVRGIMKKYAQRMKLYISLHSYGQYLVYPWGYTGNSLPPEWKKLDYLARKVSDAVERAGGQPFKVLSAGKWYAAAGGSDDYAFGEVGVPYSYTMELTDGFQFSFPQHLLETVLPQFYEGFTVFGEHIKNEFENTRYQYHKDNQDLDNAFLSTHRSFYYI